MIRYSKEFMEKFGHIVLERIRQWYRPKKRYYKLDWREPDVRYIVDWFNKHRDSPLVEAQAGELLSKWSHLSNDLLAVYTLRWVKKNIRYTQDMMRWGVKEKWQTPAETLTLGTGDCEDGALLLMALLLKMGIPKNQLIALCGNTKVGGHCWLGYISNSNGAFYYLDWCYRYDPNTIPYRIMAFLIPDYSPIWFCFDSEKTYQGFKNPWS